MTAMPAGAAQPAQAPRRRRIMVSIANHQRTRAVDLRLLRRLVRTLLAQRLPIEKAELGIGLVAAPAMTRLNETFLDHAGSTDVITFDYSSHGARPRQPTAPLHGEIIICVDEAVAQSRRFRTTWQSELVRYVVHGILHLLGFGDLKPGDRRCMKRMENRWLRDLDRRFPLRSLAKRRIPT